MRRVLTAQRTGLLLAAASLLGGSGAIRAAPRVVTSSSSGDASRSRVSTCDDVAVQAFVARAQSLDVETETQGRALLSCLPVPESPTAPAAEPRSVVVQWLAFYRAVTAAPGGGRDVDDSTANRRRASGGGLTEDIRQAQAGDYAALSAAVAANDVRVSRDAAARLALARAQVRKGLGRAGRDSYRVYLSLKPADAAVRAEFLYSLIWERSYDEAERQWTLAEQTAKASPAASTPAGQAYGEALRRGRDLLRRLQAGDRIAPPVVVAAPVALSARPAATSPTSPTPVAPPSREFAMSIERAWRAKTLRRSSVGGSYRGEVVEAKLVGHFLELSSLESAIWRAAEAALGAHDDAGAHLHGSAELGYFAVDAAGERSGLVFGHLGLAFKPIGALSFSLKAARQPLATLLPLTRDARAMPRDTGTAAFAWRDYLTLQSTLGRDGGYTLWERHSLLGKVHLLDDAETGHLALRLPARFAAHPRPHPEYDAPAAVAMGGVGFELESAPMLRTTVALSVDQLWGEVTDRKQPARHQPARELVSALTIETALRGGWRLGGKVTAAMASEPERLGTEGGGLGALATLARDLDAPAAAAARP